MTAAAVTETVAIPEPTVVVYDLGSVQALIVSYDWEDDIALAIARCESGYNPFAVNSQAVILSNGVNHATGVFQLLMPLHQWRLNGGSPFDAEANIRAAYGLWLDQGWAPWRECW